MAPGLVTTAVEVSASSSDLISTIASSVGGVVSGEKVLNLPVVSRNALGFTTLQAGTVGGNFAGARIGSLNITIDGINVQDNRINSGVFSTATASVDIIEEFRVVTSSADVEYGRGSGQIQARTRSGTNQSPATATGPLQTVNLLSYDPNRAVLDPTGTSRRFIAFTPLPNNFRIGDGLNTAGYTWSRSASYTQN